MMTYKDKLQKILSRYESGQWDEAHFLYNMAWLYSQGGQDKKAEAIQGKVNAIFKDYANGMVVNLMGEWHKHINEDIIGHVENYLWEQSTAYDFVKDCVVVWSISTRKGDKAFADGRKIDISCKLSDVTKLVFNTAKNELAAIEV